jgi:2,3-bisphosphoglycerate-independent phosphoglycerate mutase
MISPQRCRERRENKLEAWAMNRRHEVIKEQAIRTDSKIVFLVIDGLGGIRTIEQRETELERARTPNLDDLAKKSICGRSVPVMAGITPGSGPGHLGLFGYDPLERENDIGRGVLEALGIDFELLATDIAARGNFADADSEGVITDRRAGRLSTERCTELCAKLQKNVSRIGSVEIIIRPVRDYRFVLILRPEKRIKLSHKIADTDPQKTGLKPREPEALPDVERTDAVTNTLAVLNELIPRFRELLRDEKDANAFLLRGFSKDPELPKMQELYKLRPAAIANYPLYRGVAKLIGMEVLKVGPEIKDEFDLLEETFSKNYDFFFVHVKKADSYGEDGNPEGKIKIIEEVDRQVPRLVSLKPDVIVVTGDHSTPTQIKGHSWHPLPFMLCSKVCDIDDVERFSERACDAGGLGVFPAIDIMPLALANAGKLEKYGA